MPGNTVKMLSFSTSVYVMLLTIGCSADGIIKCASSKFVAHFASSETFDSAITGSHSTISPVSFNSKVVSSKKFDPVVPVLPKIELSSLELGSDSSNITPIPTFINPTEFSTFNNGANICVFLPSSDDISIDFLDTLNITNGSLNCSNITLELEDYDLLQNGSIYVKTHNLLLNKSFRNLESNTVLICKSQFKEKDPTIELPKRNCVSFVGVLISGLALFSRLLLVWFIYDYELSAKISIALAGPLVLVFDVIVCVLHFDKVSNHQNLWWTLPALSQFFRLALYSWMSIISCDIFRDNPIKVTYFLRKFNCESYFSGDHNKTFRINFIATLFFLTYMGISSVVNIISSFTFIRTEQEDFCWLALKERDMLFFGGQVFIIAVLNGFTYAHSRPQSAFIPFIKQPPRNSSNARLDYLFRSSMNAYFTWIIGALATIPSIRWMWYVFVILHVYELGNSFLMFAMLYDEFNFKNIVDIDFADMKRRVPIYDPYP